MVEKSSYCILLPYVIPSVDHVVDLAGLKMVLRRPKKPRLPVPLSDNGAVGPFHRTVVINFHSLIVNAG